MAEPWCCQAGRVVLDPGTRLCPLLLHPIQQQEMGSSQPGSTRNPPNPNVGDLAPAGTQWVTLYCSLPFPPGESAAGRCPGQQLPPRCPHDLSSHLQTHPGLGLALIYSPEPPASPKPSSGIWPAGNCGAGLEDKNSKKNQALGLLWQHHQDGHGAVATSQPCPSDLDPPRSRHTCTGGRRHQESWQDGQLGVPFPGRCRIPQLWDAAPRRPLRSRRARSKAGSSVRAGQAGGEATGLGSEPGMVPRAGWEEPGALPGGTGALCPTESFPGTATASGIRRDLGWSSGRAWPSPRCQPRAGMLRPFPALPWDGAAQEHRDEPSSAEHGPIPLPPHQSPHPLQKAQEF